MTPTPNSQPINEPNPNYPSAYHTGDLGLVHTLPLYAAGVCWTLVYDTLYGYQVD